MLNFVAIRKGIFTSPGTSELGAKSVSQQLIAGNYIVLFFYISRRRPV